VKQVTFLLLIGIVQWLKFRWNVICCISAMWLDRVVRNAVLPQGISDIGISRGRIAVIAPGLACDAPETDAAGRLVVGGLVETHIHLDKTCILDRCRASEGSVAEAVRLTAAAKRHFTPEDVYARGRRTLERCICHGTMRMRTHVELDPGIGLRGFEAVQALARDYAWAIDLQICVFPQEGLTDNPGTEALLIEGLRRGAQVIGAAPYCDRDPRGQIDRIFTIARDHDVDVDMHLDMGDTPEGMQVEYVCRKTDEFGWGGRVSVGHATQLSLLEPARFDAVARIMANAGVALAILPSTDLFLSARGATNSVPRGVAPGHRLMAHGVNCTISTNNVLNPFTPYGDGSLTRMANLYANVTHVGRPDDLATCLDMITTRAAQAMRLADYGVAVGNPADLVALDADSPANAIAELAQPLWGMKSGQITFVRPAAELVRPDHTIGHEE
jgi:cytosine deaminase